MNLSLTLDQVAAAAGGRILRGDGATAIRRFALDSRAVQAGDWFVALKGERSDGHDFLAEAFRRGAAGAVFSRPSAGIPSDAPCLAVPDTLRALQEIARAHRASLPARVIAVTGTNGKTTTKDMIGHVLARGGKSVLATKGNLNSQVGLPLTLFELGPAHSHAVLELGASSVGHIARLAELAAPRIGVLTNVGRAHLEFFGSVENIARAKWELAEALPRDGLAVLNADDPRLMERRPSLKCGVMTYGLLSPEADVRGEDVRQAPGTVFWASAGGVRREVRLSAPGLFNAYNALAALAVALWENVPLDGAVQALADFSPPERRMQARPGPRGTLFLIDAYNANPDSMAAALDSFVQAYPDRGKWAVLGGMRELGAESQREHEALGRRLAGLPVDEVFFIGPEGEAVARGHALARGSGRLRRFENHEDLCRALAADLPSGAVVLFKASRGVELEKAYGPLLEGA